jgi:hypothetical protein
MAPDRPPFNLPSGEVQGILMRSHPGPAMLPPLPRRRHANFQRDSSNGKAVFRSNSHYAERGCVRCISDYAVVLRLVGTT